MYEIEQEIFDSGVQYIAGVDEAGRGPLAGPVCVAAVVLKNGTFIEGINDSKKLSEKKREMLFDRIIKEAESYSICFIDEKQIDDLNILNATFLGMNNAVNSLSVTPDMVLIDGNAVKGMTLPHQCIIKGDAKCNSIGAASILAKVSRDRYMMKMHELYPGYAFDKHKGYPTKLHYECLEKLGISPIHRLSFLKKWKNGDGR